MSYPYVDRSIEPPLLVIESGDRVMPGISTPIGEKANPSPICPSFSCRMNVCFPPPPFNAVAFLPLFGMVLSFRPFLMHRWFHDSLKKKNVCERQST